MTLKDWVYFLVIIFYNSFDNFQNGFWVCVYVVSNFSTLDQSLIKFECGADPEVNNEFSNDT